MQPKDALNIGRDSLSAAGDYEAPNPFNQTIVSTRIQAGDKPPPMHPVKDRATLQAGFASHDRALHIQDGWIRDPYIVPGPDEAQLFEDLFPARS